MPRITPLRILLLLPLCWFGLVLLWAVLPSPPVSWDHDPSEHLWRGGTLTRVYSVDDFFIYSDHLASVQDARSTGRFSFALDYRYDRATGDLVIGYSRPREHRFSLSEALQLPAVAAAAAAAPGPSSSTSPSSSSWISTPFTVLVKTGDDDGINLPWFAPADAALLFWEIHSDTADVPLRVKVTNASSVEIWPDSREWNALSDDSELDPAVTPVSFPPLLTISLRDDLGQNDASSSSAPFTVRLPTEKPNSSPSRTLAMRRAISSIIVPIGIFVNEYVLGFAWVPIMAVLGLANVVFYALTIYVLVVLAFWAGRSFPPFWPWARSFRLTRGVVAYLGPRMNPSRAAEEGSEGLQGSSKANGEDGAAEIDLDEAIVGPTPLRSVWAFFTSRSPLDDLLVTFEVTRPFVQPLGLSLRRTRDPVARVDDEERQIETASGVSEESGSLRERDPVTETCTPVVESEKKT